ncbi:LysR family transcriptional regulator [Bradyrhizobium jicamae]|uniref:LysR family transcriptional regulator n=1 Tax=Bradyrhizobium jicamae TaxID=280332 RepID=UPI001BA79745|nr:LysR family transcriptional regulator [Bradyrhizobium jicamae]MBR0752737.1 LysR family transcriptional regulator [Bradyrhizobium jicamae]
MQLKHLRTFLAVASTLNLTRAGEKLHLSQSSVTEQIQSLESDIGTVLFDRSRRKWALTPAGTRLLEYAGAIMALSDEARGAALDEAREVIGGVVVGGVESLCTERLPALLLKYCTDFPDVRVTLRAGKTTDLYGGLKAGLLDVYFTFGISPEETGLRSENVTTERIVLVGPPNHRLSGQRSVTLDELAREDFLVTITGCPVRAAFEKAFAKHKCPRIVAEFASIAAMRNIVEQGGGCALLPASTAREALAAGKLVALPWPAQQEMPVSMRWRQQRLPPPALRHFLEVARHSLAT